MGLVENFQSEPVSRLAIREPVVASPETPIREAVQSMRNAKLGCVIAVDASQKPVGMFTESMLTQLLLKDAAAIDAPLSGQCAQQWPWVKLTDHVADVLEAMQTRNVRFICVVDDDGRLVGLTGQKGLMEYVAEHFPREVMVQRVGGSPRTQDREGA